MNKKKNSIMANIAHLFYSTILSSLLNAGALVVLASYLQAYHYGLFSVTLAFAMIMGYFTDAGLSGVVLREGAKEKVDQNVLVTSFIKLRILLLFLTFVLGLTLIYFMNRDHTELLVTAVVLILPMVSGLAMQSIGTTFFQMREKMHMSGVIRMTSAFCLVTSMTVGIFLELPPLWMTALYGASYLSAGLLSVLLVIKHVTIRFTLPFHKGLMKNLGAFTLGGLLFVMLPHLGPILLEKTIPLAAVGLFAVAYRIPQALQQVPFIVAGAYYPVLFKAYQRNNRGEHLHLHVTQIKIMSLAGMMMTIPFFYLSPFIIELLFGPEWAGAAAPLKIMSLMLTVQAVNIAVADGLTTMEKQTSRTVVQLTAVIIGAGLYTGLSLSFGVTGAAWAGVSIEVAALMGFWICSPVRKVLLKKSIFPYLSYFIVTLVVLEQLAFPSFFNAAIHLLLVMALPVMDADLRSKLIKVGGKVWNRYTKRRMKEEVNHGS